MRTKVCTKCGMELSLDEFYVDKHSSDGWQSECKRHVIERSEAWRRRNTEKHRAYSLAYAKEHWEEHKARMRRWGKENKEKRFAHVRRFREMNPDAQRAWWSLSFSAQFTNLIYFRLRFTIY